MLTLNPTLLSFHPHYIEPDPPEAKNRDIHFPEYKHSLSIWKKFQKDSLLVINMICSEFYAKL